MATLLAIDPGANTGYALFRRDDHASTWRLVNAGVYKSAQRVFLEPTYVVIENPQIYPHSKSRPADILKLARIVGKYEERYASSEIHLCSPHEWKGSIDGDIMVRRIESALTPAEIAILDRCGLTRSVRHNAIDAVGLGKWALRQPWMRGR